MIRSRYNIPCEDIKNDINEKKSENSISDTNDKGQVFSKSKTNLIASLDRKGGID